MLSGGQYLTSNWAPVRVYPSRPRTESYSVTRPLAALPNRSTSASELALTENPYVFATPANFPPAKYRYAPSSVGSHVSSGGRSPWPAPAGGIGWPSPGPFLAPPPFLAPLPIFGGA